MPCPWAGRARLSTDATSATPTALVAFAASAAATALGTGLSSTAAAMPTLTCCSTACAVFAARRHAVAVTRVLRAVATIA